MGWSAGASREEVTCFERGIQLFGWGMAHNVALEVATPMFARAVVLDDGQTPVALVLVDIGIITLTIRRHALALLREIAPECPIHDDSILLTATHTHSGPSGISEYLFYGFSGPALSESIVMTYARGIARAIADAWASRVPASVHVVEGDMPLSTPVAFNRSLAPYLQNEEVREQSLNAEEATHRRMTQLRVDRAEDRSPIAVISWFATHATSVHSDKQAIHADNRGLAALSFEEELRGRYGRDVVALFPQEAAGDVTPNFRFDPKRKLVVGTESDDHESALFVARALTDLARSLFRQAEDVAQEPAKLGSVLRYVHMPGREVSALSPKGTPAHLGDAVIGLGFTEGTREGPGPLHPLHPLARKLTRWMRQGRGGKGRQFIARHGNKIPFLETGKGSDGTLVGLFSLKRPFLPGGVDPTVATYKRYLRDGALDDQPWSPTTLPYQALRIGSLGVVTIPGEPTTMAGRRLREAVMEAAGPEGPSRVVVAGYSNDYTSYITTAEEYDEQWYEGASTLFGRYTELAMREIHRELSASLWLGRPLLMTNDPPPTFRSDLFSLRRFLSPSDNP